MKKLLFSNKNIQNFLLVLVSTFVTLLFVEVGLRLKLYLSDQKTLETLSDRLPNPAPGEEVKLGQMIILSDNSKIIYEFRPNLSVRFIDQPVHINENHFRGKAIPIYKEEGTRRILGIGDSQMFGWGAKNEETYLSVLSDQLNQHYSGCSWETVNTAVPGYNTVMEVATLREKGLAYQPDYVVVGFMGNDLSLPQFTKRQENYLSLKKSFLLAYFAQNLKPVTLQWGQSDKWRPTFEQDFIESVPEQYRDMVGVEAYKKAMEELRDLSLTHDFKVIVLISNDQDELNVLGRLVKDVSEGMGFKFLALEPMWKKYVAENNIPDPEIARFVSESDPHASSLAHRAMGLGLFEFMVGEPLGCASSETALKN